MSENAPRNYLPDTVGQRPFVVDRLKLTCQKCRLERTFWPAVPITSSEALTAFVDVVFVQLKATTLGMCPTCMTSVVWIEPHVQLAD
jgi:hypothetical protein